LIGNGQQHLRAQAAQLLAHQPKRQANLLGDFAAVRRTARQEQLQDEGFNVTGREAGRFERGGIAGQEPGRCKSAGRGRRCRGRRERERPLDAYGRSLEGGG
jgi:hypothetical protein